MEAHDHELQNWALSWFPVNTIKITFGHMYHCITDPFLFSLFFIWGMGEARCNLISVVKPKCLAWPKWLMQRRPHMAPNFSFVVIQPILTCVYLEGVMMDWTHVSCWLLTTQSCNMGIVFSFDCPCSNYPVLQLVVSWGRSPLSCVDLLLGGRSQPSHLRSAVFLRCPSGECQ